MHRIFSILILSALTGCTSISVYVEHDPAEAFAGFSSYRWATPTRTVVGDPHTDDPILDARIRYIVDAELAARGYRRLADGDVDFLVGYHASTEEKTQTWALDDYYGYSKYSRYGRGRSTVYTYEEGALILDISTADTHRLIWRAWARAVVNPTDSQEQRDAVLADAVRKMFDKFPPGRP